MTKPSQIQIAIRLDAETVAEADALAEELAQNALPGLEATRTSVLRAAIGRGLEAMRAELKMKRSRR